MKKRTNKKGYHFRSNLPIRSNFYPAQQATRESDPNTDLVPDPIACDPNLNSASNSEKRKRTKKKFDSSRIPLYSKVRIHR